MPALETVTVQHHLEKAPRQVRLSRAVRIAIDEMVMKGSNRAKAAETAGLTEHALYVALTKPHVLAYRNDRLRVIRESASARTIAKAEQLMDSAESEHVQADMTKWIAGLEGISPVSKSESTINHKGLGPGLVIQIAAPAAERVICGQPREVEFVSREKHLSLPVPHPTRGTRPAAAEISGDSSRPASRGEGEKS